MAETTAIDEAWRAHRHHVVDLAFRMLGDIGDAEDVVQEAYARLLTADLSAIDDVRGWLIVVVTRLCLDQLRSARVRRRDPQAELEDDPAAAFSGAAPDPVDRITLDDTVRLALSVVLERLSPAERTVLVLHDVFQFSFETVGDIVGRTPAACRKLASRARRHISQSGGPARFQPDLADRRRVVERFIAACAGGDLTALMDALDPEVVGVVDLGARPGSGRTNRGREQVSFILSRLFGPGTGRILVSAPVVSEPAVLAFSDRTLVGMLVLTIEAGRIHHIDAIADPDRLAAMSRHLTSPRP